MREGAAVPWILAAHVLVHTNCTTGVEAVALDKPSICLVPEGQPCQPPVSRQRRQSGGDHRRRRRSPRSSVSLPSRERCYSDNMIACFRDSMSFDARPAGRGDHHQRHHGCGRRARLVGVSPNAVSDWRAYSGYRWHQKDKNVRGILFPDESLASVEARLEQYAKLLNLEISQRVEACGSKVILLSPRPLALGTRMRRAFGALRRDLEQVPGHRRSARRVAIDAAAEQRS